MKSFLTKLLLLSTLLAIPAFAQYQAIQQQSFAAIGAGTAINESSLALPYHVITWNLSGSLSACTLAVDSSADGVTWTTGGVITGQTCTSGGNFTQTTPTTANYVRLHLTAYTGSGSVNATYAGYLSNPSGGTGAAISGSPTAGHVATWLNATTIQDGGAVSGTGTVTSVSGLSPIFTVATGTTTPTFSLSTAAINTIFGNCTGSVVAPSYCSITGAMLPVPSASTLGGVQSLASVSHNFLTSISTSGVPTQAQPAFTDISGSATQAQLPAQTYTALTDGATITWTIGSGQQQSYATVTLAGNRTLAFSGTSSGATGTLIVKQDATGSRTLTLPAGSKVINTGAGAVTLSTAANAVDILSFTYDGTNYWWTIGKSFS